MWPATQAGDSAVAERPVLRDRECRCVEELLDCPRAVRVADAIRPRVLAPCAAPVGAADADGSAGRGTPDAVELPAAKDVACRTGVRERDFPNPIHDEPMRLVKDQPSVVGRQVIGILRPDIAERRSAREIVLRVPQSFAPGVVHVESQTADHRAPQAHLQSVVVGRAVARHMVAQPRPVRERVRDLSVRVDVALVQRLELTDPVGVTANV